MLYNLDSVICQLYQDRNEIRRLKKINIYFLKQCLPRDSNMAPEGILIYWESVSLVLLWRIWLLSILLQNRTGYFIVLELSGHFVTSNYSLLFNEWHIVQSKLLYCQSNQHVILIKIDLWYFLKRYLFVGKEEIEEYRFFFSPVDLAYEHFWFANLNLLNYNSNFILIHFHMEKVNMDLINIYLYNWGTNNTPELIMEIGYVQLYFYYEL